jgi:pimeloyl-ACP methyl ester carboxylesterase
LLPGEPAWRTIPSWALVSTRDRSLPPDILLYMAERAEFRIVEVESSHAAPVTRSDVVTDLILAAVRAVSSSADTVSV